jgi:DnaJ-class molecular chaperone
MTERQETGETLGAPRTVYETCFACRGSGCELGMEGDIANCSHCKGQCVIRVRDSRGRFATKELTNG